MLFGASVFVMVFTFLCFSVINLLNVWYVWLHTRLCLSVFLSACSEQTNYRSYSLTSDPRDHQATVNLRTDSWPMTHRNCLLYAYMCSCMFHRHIVSDIDNTLWTDMNPTWTVRISLNESGNNDKHAYSTNSSVTNMLLELEFSSFDTVLCNSKSLFLNRLCNCTNGIIQYLLQLKLYDVQ